MRFSSCGQYLYYLLVLIADNVDVGSTCEVFLSIFPFEESGEGDMMRPCTEVQRLTYRFGAPTHKLRAPYVLTHWASDMLYLCLPLLSCNPKVVRFDLTNKKPNRPDKGENPIQTLRYPVFFPNSTPCRHPRILYRSSPTEKKDILVLALDSLCQANEELEGAISYPPAVL